MEEGNYRAEADGYRKHLPSNLFLQLLRSNRTSMPFKCPRMRKNGQWPFAGSIAYEGSLFRANFIVDSDGLVEMQDDDTIGSLRMVEVASPPRLQSSTEFDVVHTSDDSSGLPFFQAFREESANLDAGSRSASDADGRQPGESAAALNKLGIPSAHDRILAAMTHGSEADLGLLPPDDRRVDARWLASVLSQRSSSTDQCGRSVTITSATVTGSIDWRNESFASFSFVNCRFEQAIKASGLRVAGSARFQGCRGYSLDLGSARIDGPLNLDGLQLGGSGFESGTGEVVLNLVSARIDGDLSSPYCTILGLTDMTGIEIHGQLTCSGSTFAIAVAEKRYFSEVAALSLDNAIIRGSVHFSSVEASTFRAIGGIRLLGASITGQLNCSGAILTNHSGMALGCDGARIGSDVVLRPATFDNPSQTVFLEPAHSQPFKATGAVRFPGATIEGQLGCTGAQLNDASGSAAQWRWCHRDWRSLLG